MGPRAPSRHGGDERSESLWVTPPSRRRRASASLREWRLLSSNKNCFRLLEIIHECKRYFSNELRGVEQGWMIWVIPIFEFIKCLREILNHAIVKIVEANADIICLQSDGASATRAKKCQVECEQLDLSGIHLFGCQNQFHGRTKLTVARGLDGSHGGMEGEWKKEGVKTKNKSIF